jgi:hypothetical protein
VEHTYAQCKEVHAGDGHSRECSLLGIGCQVEKDINEDLLGWGCKTTEENNLYRKARTENRLNTASKGMRCDHNLTPKKCPFS